MVWALKIVAHCESRKLISTGDSDLMPELNEHRGRMIRRDRQMPDENTRLFLREQYVARVGTCDAAGWPYVVALMYVYESGDRLYLHTGPHHGHFLANIHQNPKICIHVGESGPLQRGKPSPCDSALVYKSAVAFGSVQVFETSAANDKKAWFFDRLMERLKEPLSAYETGYTALDRIILYEVTLEIVTGKLNVGLHH
jgi:nitroimidazol reductase NimA-like FMN-containing flavoprotein (pyridoxamine 5'-phosphate oxidase superfamily)